MIGLIVLLVIVVYACAVQSGRESDWERRREDEQ